MKQWYKISVYKAHRGAGRNESTTAYIYADSAAHVLSRYQTMPGVKRNPSRNNFPNIRPISKEEARDLEQRIIESRISLEKAKRTWYYANLI